MAATLTVQRPSGGHAGASALAGCWQCLMRWDSKSIHHDHLRMRCSPHLRDVSICLFGVLCSCLWCHPPPNWSKSGKHVPNPRNSTPGLGLNWPGFDETRGDFARGRLETTCRHAYRRMPSPAYDMRRAVSQEYALAWFRNDCATQVDE